MRRGELFRVRRPGGGDPRRSSIHCDALVSVPKSALTDHVGTLAPSRARALDQALRVALGLG